MRGLTRLLALLLISLGLAPIASAQPSDPFIRLYEFAESLPRKQIISLQEQNLDGEFVGKKMRIVVDEKRSSETEAAEAMMSSSGFTSKLDIPYFGPTQAKIWSLLVVENEKDQAQDVYFEVDYQVAQHITFTAVGDKGLIRSKRAGAGEPFSQRDKLTRTNIFVEKISPGRTLFLISTWGDVSQQMPLRIWSPDNFYHSELKRRTAIDLITGCALALLLYNIFLFVSLRESIYFFYSLYVSLNIAYHGTEHGFLREFLYYNFHSEVMPSWLNVVMVDLIVLAAYGFVHRFSAISFKSRLGKVYLFFIALAALDIFNALFISPTVSLYVATFNASAAFCIFIYSGFKIFSEAGSQVRLYIAAWSFYLFGTSGAILNYLGLIERNSFTKYGLIAGNISEMILLSLVLANRIKRIQSDLQNEQQKKLHSYEQLEKVFYPHQLEMIKNGQPLEMTMPTNPSEACVICFDIVRSSQIRHEKSKEFLRRILLRCNKAMMDGYDRGEMKANAYRIKEMGDGFLCSVGYPFTSPSGNLAQDAVDIARVFYRIFLEEVELFDYSEALHCGIGIAMGPIEGFYPESGTKEYDLYGESIILANRYEAMRKVILKDKTSASLLVLQERVYLGLSLKDQNGFQPYDLAANASTVRDDSTAQILFYKDLSEDEMDLQSTARTA